MGMDDRTHRHTLVEDVTDDTDGKYTSASTTGLVRLLNLRNINIKTEHSINTILVRSQSGFPLPNM